MKLSIVIPVYNVEKYLEECIDSAINQTLDEVEIIAVNDGSTDNSLNILKKYEKYENFHIINQANKGLSGARNTGLKEAKGEYIYFLDSDDYITLDSMEECYRLCKQNKLDIITFDAKCFLDIEKDKVNNTQTTIFQEDYDRSDKLDSKVYDGQTFYNICKSKDAYKQPIWLNMYNREFLLKNNLYFYEGLIHEDELYTIQATIKAERIMYLPKIVFNRRIRNNSIMTSKITDKNIISLGIICKELTDIYYNQEINNKTKENILNQIREFYSIALYRCYKSNMNNNKKKELNRLLKNQVSSNLDILDTKLSLQFKSPNLYNILVDLKKNIKK